MDSSTVKKIIEINKEFYQTFAEPFAVSRQRLQPGVRQILEQIEAPIKILDLGCGSGEVARFLLTKGFRGKYVGADFSNNLLEAAIKDNSNARYVETKQQAEAIYSNQDVQAIFIQADLSEPDWETKIPSLNYDCVFSFAVFHHIPGEKLRLQTLQKIHGLLQPEGLFWHSVWQFMNSARLRKRIQTWDQVNLHQNQVIGRLFIGLATRRGRIPLCPSLLPPRVRPIGQTKWFFNKRELFLRWRGQPPCSISKVAKIQKSFDLIQFQKRYLRIGKDVSTIV